jgi:hypothetical protein
MNYTFTSLTILFVLFSSLSYAQKSDENKYAEEVYLSKQLSTSKEVTKKVMQEMVLYKEATDKITSNVSLTPELMKIKLDSLTGVKNKKLLVLLTPKQYEIFVPTTDRDKR